MARNEDNDMSGVTVSLFTTSLDQVVAVDVDSRAFCCWQQFVIERERVADLGLGRLRIGTGWLMLRGELDADELPRTQQR